MQNLALVNRASGWQVSRWLADKGHDERNREKNQADDEILRRRKKRTVVSWGWTIPALAVLGLLYGYFGYIFPEGLLFHAGVSLERLIGYTSIPYFRGLLGSLTNISASITPPEARLAAIEWLRRRGDCASLGLIGASDAGNLRGTRAKGESRVRMWRRAGG